MARIFVRPGVEMRKLTLFAACATSLAACGSPPPNAVGVFVETFPPGASCIVSRGDQPIGQIDQTPGIATVPNQEADYLVSCRRSGFEDVASVIHARALTTYLVIFGRKSHPPPRWSLDQICAHAEVAHSFHKPPRVSLTGSSGDKGLANFG